MPTVSTLSTGCAFPAARGGRRPAPHQLDDLKRQHAGTVHNLKQQIIRVRDKRDELDTHNRNLARELEDTKAALETVPGPKGEG